MHPSSSCRRPKTSIPQWTFFSTHYVLELDPHLLTHTPPFPHVIYSFFTHFHLAPNPSEWNEKRNPSHLDPEHWCQNSLFRSPHWQSHTWATFPWTHVLPQSLSHSFLPPYCFLMPELLELSLKCHPASPFCTYKNWLRLPEHHFSHFTWIFFSKDLENVRSYLEKSPLTMTFNLTLHLACQFLPLLWSGPYENLTSKVESFQFLEEKKNKTEQPIWQK